MMGFPLAGPKNGYNDNMSVIHNVSKIESVLKKKRFSVCYHRVQESSAKGAIQIAYEGTNTMLADVCTKILPPTKKRELMRHIVY